MIGWTKEARCVAVLEGEVKVKERDHPRGLPKGLRAVCSGDTQSRYRRKRKEKKKEG